MMKNKTFRVSLLLKIWSAIMAVVIAVLLLIWGLQVVFLEQYYVGMKKSEFSSICTQIVDEIDQLGYIGSQNNILELVAENRLCVEILRRNGQVIKVEGMPYDCYIHKRNSGVKQDLLMRASLDNDDNEVINVWDQASKTEYLILCAQQYSTSEDDNYILLVNQTLAPVREAATVTRSQLTYLSIILVVLATVAAFLIARIISKPIGARSRAAQKGARGNLDVAVTVKNHDEIGDLCKNFNQMTTELSKVNRLQRELVANLSHDLRTPLTMIRGYAEMIKDITGDDKEKREEQLDIIVDETNRLNRLASDALDLSRMQAGQVMMNKTVFDGAKKLHDILSRYQLLTETEGFTFVCNTPDSCFVYADEMRIEQVIYNLLNNAVNHIGEPKVITTSLVVHNDIAYISVKDTGKGIRPEDLPLIWDRYYKPYRKTDRPGMGTGLGLSIVKAILNGHNAPFGVDTAVGKGSTFWFGLTVYDETKPLPTDETPAQEGKNNGAGSERKN